MEIHSLFLGVPLLLVILLVARIWSRKGPHPETYKMSESWTHPPILWAATDEVIGHGHGGHGAAEFSVGGGASGKWGGRNPQARRAAPSLGDHDQWTDLGCHRTR